MKVTISKGNTKLGSIHNVSLPPCKTCKGRACLKKCYANKAWKMYEATRKAWAGNYEAYKKDPANYFVEITNHCHAKKVKRFRWHVAGDIVDNTYLSGIVATAMYCPDTEFLCFTKYMGAIRLHKILPENLKVIFSMWPGSEADTTEGFAYVKKSRIPLAWFQPKELDQKSDYARRLKAAKKKAFECTGSCSECFRCWDLEPSKSVVFHEH